MDKTNTIDNQASFERVMEGLQGIVERLEEGDLSLEESLQTFEEGVRLSRRGQAQLEQAERRVEQLLSRDGKTEPLDDIRDTDE